MANLLFNQLEIDLPDEWVDLSVITVVAREATTFRPNVVITREQTNADDLEAYAKKQIREFRKQMKRYAVHREERMEVGAREAYLLEHSFMSPENVPVRQIQVYVPDGALVLALSFTHAEDQFETLRETFETAVRSFRLR